MKKIREEAKKEHTAKVVFPAPAARATALPYDRWNPQTKRWDRVNEPHGNVVDIRDQRRVRQDNGLGDASAAMSSERLNSTIGQLADEYMGLFDPTTVADKVITLPGMMFDELQTAIKYSGLAKRFRNRLSKDLRRYGAVAFKGGLLIAAERAKKGKGVQ